MTSPAERYAAARRRAEHAARHPALGRVRRAGSSSSWTRSSARRARRWSSGSGVLVCAPTGAGKTVVGEFAVHLALAAGAQVLLHDADQGAVQPEVQRPGRAGTAPTEVGLLTGDNAINGDAPVVVMTTEVLRNMLYAGSTTLRDLAYVVMDEVHYLADRFRGAVWEEVIIHLPESVTLVSLSATVSNAEEFADWLVTVRGETRVVVSEHRPVPLWQHMLVGKRMFDLFHDADGGPDARGAPGAAAPHPGAGPAASEDGYRRGRGGRGRRAAMVPPRRRSSSGWTGRACCRRSCSCSAGPAATPPSSSASHAGLRLTDPEERAEIRRSSRPGPPTCPART